MIKNNKGITIVELIISFAIISVATIYFFQTFYTVKKIYFKTREKSKEYADVNYAFRILSVSYAAKGSCDSVEASINNSLNFEDDDTNKFFCLTTDYKDSFAKVSFYIYGKPYSLYVHNTSGITEEEYEKIEEFLLEKIDENTKYNPDDELVVDDNIIIKISKTLLDSDNNCVGYKYIYKGNDLTYIIEENDPEPDPDPDSEGLNPNGEFNGNDEGYEYSGEGDETVTPNIDDDLWW